MFERYFRALPIDFQAEEELEKLGFIIHRENGEKFIQEGVMKLMITNTLREFGKQLDDLRNLFEEKNKTVEEFQKMIDESKINLDKNKIKIRETISFTNNHRTSVETKAKEIDSHFIKIKEMSVAKENKINSIDSDKIFADIQLKLEEKLKIRINEIAPKMMEKVEEQYKLAIGDGIKKNIDYLNNLVLDGESKIKEIIKKVEENPDSVFDLKKKD